MPRLPLIPRPPVGSRRRSRSALARGVVAGSLLLLTAGCPVSFDPVTVTGTAVLVGDRETPQADVRVSALLGLDLVPGPAVTTGTDGGFSLRDMPASETLFTVLDREEDGLPSAYSGRTGIEDFEVPIGAAAMFTAAAVEEQLEAWAQAAPEEDWSWVPDRDSAASGGIVIGAVSRYVPGVDVYPPIDGVRATLYDIDGVEYPARYGDGEGGPGPAAEVSARDGRFWVFGVPAGVYELDVRWPVSGGTRREAFLTYVPEDGVGVLDGLVLAD